MRALVTGAGGFLGRYIVEQLLARGVEVRGLARQAYPDLERLGAEMVRGDIRDLQTVTSAAVQVDAVFHTAAVADIWGPWDYFYSINVQGTLNVIAACQQANVRKLVYTSSPSVTFDGTDQCGIDETATYPQRWQCH